MMRSRRSSQSAWLLPLLLAGLLPSAAFARAEYSEEGAKACIDCHETPEVMGILETAHAKVSDPKTPAAQKECQSCHGPSATHMQFPMQVSNIHFGKASDARPELQNAMCLECHQDGDRSNWKGSAHGFEKVVCSSCHSMHDPDRIVPARATLSNGCTTDACHQELMADVDPSEFTHALGKQLNGGQLTCAGCHNPHGPLNSNRCLECHEQTAEILAKESPKAQRYHKVAEQKGTECIRCHKGIAHPIPPLILEQSRAEMEELLGE